MVYNYHRNTKPQDPDGIEKSKIEHYIYNTREKPERILGKQVSNYFNFSRCCQSQRHSQGVDQDMNRLLTISSEATPRSEEVDKTQAAECPEYTEAHFISTLDTENKKSELVCGYLFCENSNRLFTISGLCKNGKLDLRKSEIRVGENGILHWTAFLAQAEEQRQNPTPYADLWAELGLGETDSKVQSSEADSDNQVFNYSRAKRKADKGTADVSIRSFGKSAVSEVSADFQEEDLIITTKTTIFNGKTHVRNAGVTNYLFHAIQELMTEAAAGIVELLESKAKNGEGSDKEPILS